MKVSDIDIDQTKLSLFLNKWKMLQPMYM